MPVETGMARRRSSSRNPREALVVEVELARQIWAAVASIGQVRNWRAAAEARSLKRSKVHRCRTMSRGEGSKCHTARHGLQCRTARHGLLKMMPHMDDAVVLGAGIVITQSAGKCSFSPHC